MTAWRGWCARSLVLRDFPVVPVGGEPTDPLNSSALGGRGRRRGRQALLLAPHAAHASSPVECYDVSGLRPKFPGGERAHSFVFHI